MLRLKLSVMRICWSNNSLF